MTPPTVAPRNERVNIAILNLNPLVDPRTLHPSYIHAGICHGFFGRSSLSTRPCLSELWLNECWQCHLRHEGGEGDLPKHGRGVHARGRRCRVCFPTKQKISIFLPPSFLPALPPLPPSKMRYISVSRGKVKTWVVDDERRRSNALIPPPSFGWEDGRSKRSREEERASDDPATFLL